MVSEERPDRQEEEQELVPVDSKEVVPVEVGEPTVPQGISEEEREELGKRAQELVRELSNAEGAKERELIDDVANVGIQAQSRPTRRERILHLPYGGFTLAPKHSHDGELEVS